MPKISIGQSRGGVEVHNPAASASVLPVTSNIVAWYKADTVYQADGSPVAIWNDSSGAAPLMQNNLLYQPTLKTNFRNGLSVISFTNGQFFRKDFQINIPTTWTSFVIAQFAALPATQIIYDIGGNSGSPQGFGQAATYPISGTGTILYNLVAWYGPAAGVFPSGILKMIESAHDGAILYEFIDGVQSYGVAQALPSYANPLFFVGADFDSGSDHLEGYIAELIIYKRYLSPAERLSVETYLRNKWGTP